MKLRLFLGVSILLTNAAFSTPAYLATADGFDQCLKAPPENRVRLETELGPIEVELYGKNAPATVCNFLRYVQSGYFEDSSFYRTVRDDNQQDVLVKISVIQADVRKDFQQAFPPIPIERTTLTHIHHVDGTISMARGEPNSATSSFFITIGQQTELDYGGKRNPDGQGFAAFGRVVRGLSIVKAIWMRPSVGQNLNPPVKIKHVVVL